MDLGTEMLLFSGALGGASSPVTPLVSQDWRLPISDTYDEAASAADKAALLASSTNKLLPRISVAASPTSALTVTSIVANGTTTITVNATAHGLTGNPILQAAGTSSANANGLFRGTVSDANTITYTAAANVAAATIGGTVNVCTGRSRNVSLKVGAVAAPGGLIHFVAQGINGAWSIPVFQSTDSADGSPGSGTWNANSFTPWLPAGITVATSGPQSQFPDRGQLIQIAPNASPQWVRLAIVNYDPGNALNLNIGAFKNDNPDIGLYVGMSITYQGVDPIAVRQRARSLYPNRDLIVINQAVFGYTTAQINSNILAPWLALGVVPGWICYDPGPNDMAPPLATDPTPTDVAVGMTAGLALLAATGRPYFISDMGHSNISGVNDLLNGSTAGNEAYNVNQANPVIKALAPAYNWRAALDLPLLTQQVTQAWLPPYPNFNNGTTHNGDQGIPTENELWDAVHDYISTGSAGKSTFERYVDKLTKPIPAVVQSRAVGIYNLLPATGDAGALAARAAVLATLNGLSTTFADPAGTSLAAMATPPNVWFDPSNWSTLTLATGPVGEGSVSSYLVSAMLDRIGGSLSATQATQNLQPVYVPGIANGLGMLRGSNKRVQLPSGYYSLLNAANQSFMIVWVRRSHSVVGAAWIGNGPIFSIGSNSGLNAALQVYVGPGGDAEGNLMNGPLVVKGSTSGVPTGVDLLTESSNITPFRPVVESLLFNGTTLSLRRNGVQIGSAAWTKPAWTASTAFLFGSGQSADTTRWAGEEGDHAIWPSYSLTVAADAESRLMTKWAA